MTLTIASEQHLADLVQMGRLLWKEERVEDLEKTFKETFYRPHEITFVAYEDGQPAGLAIFSLRSEYVEGASSSPVGYLEALIVAESFRRSGLAGLLLEKGTEWCLSKGCTQLGSDVELDNLASQGFHLKHQFKEVNRLVNYIKEI